MLDNPFTEFDGVVSKDLVPLIDRRFRTMPDREAQGARGLSMGGGEAMRIGLHHPDLFAYIGLFSPAIGNLDPARDYDGKLAEANRQLRLLWIGIGRDDTSFIPASGTSREFWRKRESATSGLKAMALILGQCGANTLPTLRRGCFDEGRDRARGDRRHTSQPVSIAFEEAVVATIC